MSKKKSRDAAAFQARRVNSQAIQPKANKTEKKIRLLYHGDSPKVNTGFGVVAREVLSRLNATGKYEIHCVGINDKGDPNRFAECQGMIHYPLPHYHEDPYGCHKLPEVMAAIKPDVIFTLNDIWVLDGHPKNGNQGWFVRALKKHAPNVPWVLYFPVDSRPWTMQWANLAFTADKTIVYSKYAIDVLKELREDFDPIYINHGVSLDRFNLIDFEDRQNLRKGMNVEDDNFLIGFISRNQPRKNPAIAIEVFKMANEGYRKCNSCGGIRNLDDPKCELCGESNENAVEFPSVLDGKGKLYLHCNFLDNMGANLHKVIADNNAGEGIIYNPEHSIPYGLPAEEFNAILNCLDCHFLPTMAEGFGLTILEGMAAGVPTVATRTTAVTELLEQGGGYPVIPICHHVFDDAANTRKHLINKEAAIKTIGDIYADWKLKQSDSRWGPVTTTRVEKGLKFAKEFTWDKAAKEFDFHIQDAIANRVKIVDQFTEKENLKVMFQKAGNSGEILQSLLAIKRLKESAGESEFVYAMPSNLMSMFDRGRMPFLDSIIPMDKMSDKNPYEKKIKLQMVTMTGAEERYERGTYPFIDRSRPEIYCLQLNVSPEDATLAGLWSLFDDEKEKGREIFEAQVGPKDPDKFVVGFANLANERRKAWGNGMANWSQLKKYVERMGMSVFTLDPNSRLPENLAALSMCDLVVSVDSDILDFLHALDVPTIALISPFWRVRVKNWKNVKVVSKDEFAQRGMREDLNAVDAPSEFMDRIGVGEVFSPILTYNKAWQHARKAEKAMEEQVKEEVNV